jgi:hypothetical protein
VIAAGAVRQATDQLEGWLETFDNAISSSVSASRVSGLVHVVDGIVLQTAERAESRGQEDKRTRGQEDKWTRGQKGTRGFTFIALPAGVEKWGF